MELMKPVLFGFCFGLLVTSLILMYGIDLQSFTNKPCYVVSKEVVETKLMKEDQKRVTCPKHAFQQTLLVLIFNFPFYDNIKILNKIYGKVFGKVVTCGPKPKNETGVKYPDIILQIGGGYFGYHCAGVAIERYPGYKGYMSGNDDMIINWWNLLDNDQNKIWQGPPKFDFNQPAFGELKQKDWIWWGTDMGIKACQNYYRSLKRNHTLKHLLWTYLYNGKREAKCALAWSDYFYIPARFAQDFKRLSNIARENKLFLEIAVFNILLSLDKRENFEHVNGLYLTTVNAPNSEPTTFWQYYDRDISFLHPFKLHIGDTKFNEGMLNSHVIKYTENLLKRNCTSTS